MSVGVQREACRKMPQHTRYGLDVHTVLQCQRCEGMAQVVEPDMLQPRVLEDPLVECYDLSLIHILQEMSDNITGMGWKLLTFLA